MPRRFRNKKSQISKALKNLKTLAYRSKIASKMSQINTASVFYGVREVNDLDDGAGKVSLSQSSTNDTYPLAVIPIRSIVNNDVAGDGLYILKRNGYDFTNIQSVAYAGQKGNVMNRVNSASYGKMLHRYTDLRLLLWQNSAKDVKFTCYLVKFNDSTLDPLINTTVSSTEDKDLRKQFYYYHLTRAQTSNPLIQDHENFTQGIKGKFKILWEKNYTIQEKHGQMEEAHYEQVKFFRKWDQIVDFNEKSQVDGTPPDNDPDQIKYVQAEANPTTYPDTRQNYFFIIVANATKSEADGNTSTMDKCTFDITMKNKYTINTGNKSF